MARKLVVEIVGDASSLQKTFRQAEQSTDKLNRELSQTTRGTIAGSGAFKSFGRSVAFASGSFLGAAGLAAAIRTSSDAASNLAEQTNKVNAVFKGSARLVLDFGKTTARTMGIANDQALEAAGTFGNLFNTVHLNAAANARLSTSLVKLAADLASFNNASPEDTLDALRSGLIGEAEPLRRFGVLLSETRVQQEAMRETGKQNARQLTDQEKVLARYNLILKDTAPAQGDFAKTSGGLANEQRRLSAQLRDSAAALGKNFNPAIQDMTSFMITAIDAANKLAGAVNKIPGGSFSGWDLARSIGHGLRGLGQRVFGGGTAGPTVAPGTEGIRLRGLAGSAALTGAGRGGAVRGPRWRASMAFQASVLQQQLAQAELTTSQRDDRAVLVRMQSLLRRRITATKDLKLSTQLTQDLGSVNRQIQGIDEQAATDRRTARQKELDERKKELADAKAHAAKLKAHAAKLKALEKERQQRALARLTAAQFRQLGFGPTGADVIPSGKELLKRLGKTKDQVKGTVLDTKENRKLLQRIRETLVDGLGKLAPEVRSKIDELLDALDIEDAAKKRGKKKPFDFGRRDFGHGFGGLPEFMPSGLTRFGTPAGLPVPKPLTAAQLPPRLQVNRMEIHLHGVQNVRQLEHELASRTQQRPHTRRGPV